MGFQSDRVYELYWIREPHHTNIKKEGYVGITCKGVERCFNEHCWTAEKGEGWTLQSKIREHGKDNLLATTVCIGGFDYIKDLELKLRPYPYIGWNHAKGGGGHTPEFASERQKRTAQKMKEDGTDLIRIERYKESMKKYWDDEEFLASRAESLRKSWEGADERRKNASEVAKANWEDPVLREQMMDSIRETIQSPEHREKMSEVHTERWANASEEDREKHRQGASKAALKRYSENPWWRHPSCNQYSAKYAGKAYEVWSSQKAGHKKIEQIFGLPHYSLDSLIKRFRKGWNPFEDQLWMKEFNNVRET